MARRPRNPSQAERRSTTLEKFREWRQLASVQKQRHEWMARGWAVFAIYGTVDYAIRNGIALPKDGIADSIPILFLISVLAMYQGEKSQAGNYRIEEKQEGAERSAHTENPPNAE